MSSPSLNHGVALFQTSRRQKRGGFGALEQDNIIASQIIQFNPDQNNIQSGIKTKTSGIQQVLIGSKEQFMIGLNSQGQVFIWGDFSMAVPLEEGNLEHNKDKNFKNVKINQIASSDTVAFFLSNEGTLYAWGDDSQNKYGILGLGNQFKAARPCPNSQLFDYMIKNVSLSETHGCAVDSTGRLFCWGFGPNGELGLENQQQQVSIPTIVTKQKQIIIKKAIAHTGYTAFCSSAGYVYIYGSLYQQMGKIQGSQQRFGFNSCTNSQAQRSSQQSNQLRSSSKDNPLRKSSNRPLNSMIQIISLNDNFVSNLACGDTFLICLTSQGEVFFVDDSLESVLISHQSIDDVAIQGSKILGISQQSSKLYQWSTAGLNKLSFNKENKVLLRQDFSIKEYLIKKEFNQNAKLMNLPSSNNFTALVFEDTENKAQEFAQSQKEMQDDYYQQQHQQQSCLVLAEFVPSTFKQSKNNPLCNESSFEESKDQILDQEQQLHEEEEKEQEVLPKLEVSQDSFQNDDTTPEISIAENNFIIKHESQPSFRITETTEQDEQIQPSEFLNEKDINNIFNYQQEQANPPQINVLQPSSQQNHNNNANHKKHKAYFTNNLFQPIYNQTQFFDSILVPDQNQNNFPYRPSSIKSFKQSHDGKSQGGSSYNNNSSPSLKQCADQMQGIRNSKMELSYPSFLNLSGEHQQNKENQHLGQYQFSPEMPQKLIVQAQDNKNEQKLEFKIQFQQCESMNLSQSNKSSASSREASLVRRTRQINEDELEESFEITIDNLKIKTKRTTTPKRILNAYSQNKRTLQAKNTNDNSQQNAKHIVSNNKSQLSAQSELSNGFNITQNSMNGKERKTDQKENINFGQEELTQIQNHQQQRRSKHMKKLSNSCGSTAGNKKRSFIQAVLAQQKTINNNLFIENNPTSVTQIYETCPIKEESPQDDSQSLLEQEEEEQMKINQDSQNQSDSQGIYYIYGDSSSTLNNIQPLAQQQRHIIQPRYSMINQQNQALLMGGGRESLGPVTQTDDNFEVEYTISNSCTPDSKQSDSNIKRRINFDDASAEYVAGGVIRVSDVYSSSRGGTTSFIIKQRDEATDQKQVFIQKISNPSQSMNQILSDHSQSFIFNNCQSPQYQIQPFNEENLNVSNIKSNSTLSNQVNNTNLILLTEEKFKNLKTEISQQQLHNQKQNNSNNNNDQVNNTLSNQFLMGTNHLTSSPLLTELNNFTKADSTQVYYGQNNMHNLSSFIKHSKYFQVYENYRRGFGILAKLKDQRMSQALRRIKSTAQDQKQKKEFMLNFAKYLANILKGHIAAQKSFGLKRLKKFYKERQLHSFIQKKQNEFAFKTQALVKVDQILVSHIQLSKNQAFQSLHKVAAERKKQALELRKKAIMGVVQCLARKNKVAEEKALRQIANWVNYKKFQEMNLKMLSRVLNKVFLLKKKETMVVLNHHAKQIQKQRIGLSSLMRLRLKLLFNQFREETINREGRKTAIIQFLAQTERLTNKTSSLNAFKQWKLILLRSQKIQYINGIFNQIQLTQAKKQAFEVFRSNLVRFKERQAILKINKASLLFLFKKIDDLRKQALRVGFKEIQQQLPTLQNTTMINKSNTQTNLSFNNILANQSDISLILNYKKKEDTFLKQQFRTQQQQNPQVQEKSLGKKFSQGQQQHQFMKPLNQTTLDTKSKKPTLNDYLSYTPNNQQMQLQQQDGKPILNKFFMRRKTDGCTTTKNQQQQQDQQKIQLLHRTQPPLPERHLSKRQENNRLNLSIKDLNLAFKDQITKLKEKQEEEMQQDYSYMNSSFQNTYVNNQSYDKTHNPIDYQQNTPDQFNISIEGGNQMKKVSPKINPLCISESYQIFKAGTFQHLLSTETHNNNHFVYNQHQQSQSQRELQQEDIKEEFQQDESNRHRDINLSNTVGVLQLNKEASKKTITSDFAALNRRKSDQRYSEQQQQDEDFLLELDQQQDMFEELEENEGGEGDGDAQEVAVGFDDQEDLLISYQNQKQKNFVSQKKESLKESIAIQQAYMLFKQQQQTTSTSQLYMPISPHTYQGDESAFLPSTFNRDLLNEIAANYQMIELTPDPAMQATTQFNQESSVYSHADPVEINTSPRNIGDLMMMAALEKYQVYAQNQILDEEEPDLEEDEIQDDFKVDEQKAGEDKQQLVNQDEVEEEEDFGQEISQIIRYSQENEEQRPYDFELSSHSKFKIISQQAQNILTSMPSQPSHQLSGICKKLSFGYDLKNSQNQNRKKGQQNTVSHGEQTINFNLTQEEESEDDDNELDVGEEKPARFNRVLPQSRILQQEQQEEKLTLSQQELMIIAANRQIKLQQQQQQNQQTAADFISSNVQKLKSMMKTSPSRGQQQEATRNFARLNNPQSQSYDIYNKSSDIYNSFAQRHPSLNTYQNTQEKDFKYFGGATLMHRNPSKENRLGVAPGVVKKQPSFHSSSSHQHQHQQQQQQMLKQTSTTSLRKDSYQPLTFRSGSGQNQGNGNNLFANMMERRISYQEQQKSSGSIMSSRAGGGAIGSYSQREEQANSTRSRNGNQDKVQTFLTMGNKFMTSATNSIKHSQNSSFSNHLRNKY